MRSYKVRAFSLGRNLFTHRRRHAMTQSKRWRRSAHKSYLRIQKALGL